MNYSAEELEIAPVNSSTVGTFMMVLVICWNCIFCFQDRERLMNLKFMTMIATQNHCLIGVEHFARITGLCFAAKVSWIVAHKINSQNFFVNDFFGKHKAVRIFVHRFLDCIVCPPLAFLYIFLQIINSLTPWAISLSPSYTSILRWVT